MIDVYPELFKVYTTKQISLWSIKRSVLFPVILRHMGQISINANTSLLCNEAFIKEPWNLMNVCVAGAAATVPRSRHYCAKLCMSADARAVVAVIAKGHQFPPATLAVQKGDKMRCLCLELRSGTSSISQQPALPDPFRGQQFIIPNRR